MPIQRQTLSGGIDILTGAAEGVLVAKKDYNLPKHNEIDTKNLYVHSSAEPSHPHPLTFFRRSSKRVNLSLPAAI